MDQAVQLDNVDKYFRLLRGRHTSLKGSVLSIFRGHTPEQVHALKKITMSMNNGETVAVIGKNGSGKSTLLRIIGRVYKPSSGTVKVGGRMATMLDLGAGFHPELTGRENIFFDAAIMGLGKAEIAGKLDSIIEFAELEEFIDSPVKTFSAGMLMRLGFSIAVQTDPDILLIDEVLAVGDVQFQQKCYDRIEVFKKEGRTILFVTHDLDAARAVASRTIWLDHGEIRADGDTPATIESYLQSLPHTQHPEA